MCPSAQPSTGRGDEKPLSTCELSDQSVHAWVAASRVRPTQPRAGGKGHRRRSSESFSENPGASLLSPGVRLLEKTAAVPKMLLTPVGVVMQMITLSLAEQLEDFAGSSKWNHFVPHRGTVTLTDSSLPATS